MEVFSDKTEMYQEVILKSDKTQREKTFVHAMIGKYLKAHQTDGIKFLFENCYGQNSGCILAHCMGLGKTLQAIALLHTVINSKEYHTNKILVLCPISTISNWKEEVVRWLGPIDDGLRKLQILELDQKDDIHRKIACLQNWSQRDSKSSAVCLLMGYESFRNLVNFHVSKTNVKKYSASCLSQIRQRLQNYLLESPDIVICDEGHVIKNNAAAITLAVNQIQTKRRIILTGTPVQNHLMEYFSMVNFVKPNFLGTKQHFNEYFAEPIKSGQHADSCEADIKYMKQRSYALNKKLSKIVQRREISLLKDFLPEKFEFVLFVPLTQIQYDLYDYFLRNRGGVIEYKRLFGDYTCLRKVIIIPDRNSLLCFLNGIWTHLKVLDNAHQKSIAKKKRATNKDNGNETDEDDAEEEYASPGALQLVDNDWWRKVIDKKQLENASTSYKMILLFEILKECQRVGDKCVVFSSFVEVLNVVEFFMQKIDQRQKNGSVAGLENFYGPWQKNEDYYRFDGNTPKERRHTMIKKFNDVSNTRTKVFLISSLAGGQGINLYGANRLILLDTSWNPATDQQSIFRIYRMGQTKHCYIYRLLSMGTMEEKIYSRSVTKQAMSCRVVDKQQIDRHYSMNELYELYSLTKTNMATRPAPILPKDCILAHLLQVHPNMVYKYLEHDSLLANKVEEELNEVEKKEAWQRCQEQNLQMQSLNMTCNEQPTASTSSFSPHDTTVRVPFKSLNQVVPGQEVKERSVLNTSKKTDFSAHNKENMSFGNEKVIPESVITINDNIDERIASSGLAIAQDIFEQNDLFNRPSTGHELELECSEYTERSYIETPNTEGFLLLEEHAANGNNDTNEEIIESSGLEILRDICDTSSGPSKSNELEFASPKDKATTSFQTSNVEELLLPMERVVNGNNDSYEGRGLAIAKDICKSSDSLKGPSKSDEMELEYPEDEGTATSIETSNIEELLLPMKRVVNGNNDSIEGRGLAMTKDICKSSDSLKGPSKSDEMELEYPEDEGTATETSNIEELLLPMEHVDNGNNDSIEGRGVAIANDICKSSYSLNGPSKSNELELESPKDEGTATSIETSNFEELLLPMERVVNGNINAMAKDIFKSSGSFNGPSKSDEMELEYLEDEGTTSIQTSNVEELLLPMERVANGNNDSIEGRGLAIAKDICKSSDSLKGPSKSNELELESPKDKGTATSIETSNFEELLLPMERVVNGNKDSIEGRGLAMAKDIFKSSDSLNGTSKSIEMELESPEDEGTATETSNVEELLLPMEHDVNGNNDSIEGRGLAIAKDICKSSDSLNGPFTSNLKELTEVTASSVLGNRKMDTLPSPEHSETKAEEKASLIESSSDGTQGLSLLLENVENGNKDTCEGRTKRSLSDFVKGLLDTLNNKYAAPDAMEDYVTDVEILRSNQLNNFEYRIAFKRPANSTIQRPIKRLKLSLEIDPTAAISVSNVVSTLPNLTAECQPNTFSKHSQSLDTNDGIGEDSNVSVGFLNNTIVGNSSYDEDLCSVGPEQSMELVSRPSPDAFVVDECFNGDVGLGKIDVNENESEERALDSDCVESTFAVDTGNGFKRWLPNEVDELSHERDDDEDMSSSQHSEEEPVVPIHYYGRVHCTESESEPDSLADMSESEMSSADARRYDEQPSMMSKIRSGCILM